MEKSFREYLKAMRELQKDLDRGIKNRLIKNATELCIMYCMPKIVIKNDDIKIEYHWTSQEAQEVYEKIQEQLRFYNK